MKIAVLGCGSIGRRHLQNLSQLGVGDLFAFDVVPEATRQVQSIPGVTAFAGWPEILDRKPDAVVVATPPVSHVDFALEAAKAGCHLFIEKPLSHRWDGVDNLIDEIQNRNLISMVGCNMRFHPSLAYIKSFVQEGRLGKIYSVQAEVGSYLPSWRPGTDYRANYAAQRAQGGGVLLDSIHEMDYLRWIMGDISEVQCFSGRQSDLDIDTEDTAAVLLRFSSGAIGTLVLDYCQQSYARQAKWVGQKGILTWDLTSKRVRFYENASQHWQELHQTADSFDPNQMYVDEMRAFIAGIEKGQPVSPDVADAARTLQLTLRCKEIAGLEPCPTV